MSTEPDLQSSIASIVEDVLQHQRNQFRNVDFKSLANLGKTDEASLRRNEAAGWLRKKVGVVAGKDLPAEPSDAEFRLGLRSGIILCNVLNKVQPGSVPKVVARRSDTVLIPDGESLSAFEYFENVRNFLVAVEQLGIPTFEVSDLEQGGDLSRIVNCVLAMKSYYEWKEKGRIGSWSYDPNAKTSGQEAAGKPLIRINSVPVLNSNFLARTLSKDSAESFSSEQPEVSETDATPNPLSSLVKAALLGKKLEEIPSVVESMIINIMEEFAHRLASQNNLSRASSKGEYASEYSLSRLSSLDHKVEVEVPATKVEVEAPREVEVAASVEKAEEPRTVQVDSETPPREENEGTSSKNIENQECYSEMLAEQQRVYEESKSHLLQMKEEMLNEQQQRDEASKAQLLKQLKLVEQKHHDIQQFKRTLRVTKEVLHISQMKSREEFDVLGKQMHLLAEASSGYQRVLEENRKLYSQLQDLKGNIRVYCRVRPFLAGQATHLDSVVDNIDEGNITIKTSSENGKDGRKSFTFNKVFGPLSTQAEVFADTQPLIRSVLDGYNVCIFAYGQTGSGKTYTMTGSKEHTEEDLGVNYRALTDLFLLSKQKRDTICYEISVQLLEIYDEQVRDLLVSDGDLNKNLEIHNSSSNGFNVPDATLVPVTSTTDVINLMNLGQKNRSSRSHCCLTVHVQGKDQTSGTILRGSMHLVDLAGSENVEKSEVKEDEFKESSHINKSLSGLEDVIASLAQKSSHIPYQNSKLTQLLQDSLGAQAKALMFAHISPEPEALEETLTTLKFAERVATVELGSAKSNQDTGEMKELKEQITSLKTALASKEAELEQLSTHHSRASSPERLRTKFGVSPSPSSRRQSLENATTPENGSTFSSRRQSLDLQELSTHSLPWSQFVSPALSIKDDDRDSISSDCVDKVTGSSSPLLNLKFGSLEPEKLFGTELRSPTRRYSEPNLNKLTLNRRERQDSDVQRAQSEVGTTDYSDHDAATSDCSETDSVWRSNYLKVTQVPSGTNALAPKAKIPQPKPAPAPAPAPTIDISKSSFPPLSSTMLARKPGKQQGGAVGRRKTGVSK